MSCACGKPGIVWYSKDVVKCIDCALAEYEAKKEER